LLFGSQTFRSATSGKRTIPRQAWGKEGSHSPKTIQLRCTAFSHVHYRLAYIAIILFVLRLSAVHYARAFELGWICNPR